MKKENQCLPGLHTDVPIVEGDQTVGLVCMTCGRSVREDMAESDYYVSENGAFCSMTITKIEGSHHRKDPRF